MLLPQHAVFIILDTEFRDEKIIRITRDSPTFSFNLSIRVQRERSLRLYRYFRMIFDPEFTNILNKSIRIHRYSIWIEKTRVILTHRRNSNSSPLVQRCTIFFFPLLLQLRSTVEFFPLHAHLSTGSRIINNTWLGYAWCGRNSLSDVPRLSVSGSRGGGRNKSTRRGERGLQKKIRGTAVYSQIYNPSKRCRMGENE